MFTNWLPLSFWVKYFLLGLPLTLLGALLARFLPDFGTTLTIIIYVLEMVFGFSLIIAATNEDYLPTWKYGGMGWAIIFTIMTPFISAMLIRDHLALRGIMIFVLSACVAKIIDGISFTDTMG